MWIKTFNLLADQEAEIYKLKNCPVVIDGSNYFYNVYKDSGLPFAFGCECEKLADYIRDRLAMFESANVTCYFLFKGGINDIEANMKKKSVKPKARDYDPTQKDVIFDPLFTQDVCMQVLKEMGIKYTICKMEVKKQCIALARELNCPIISYDIEYCFSNVPYIMSNTLLVDESNSEIKCRLFRLNNFLDKYSLTKEKLVYFILLRDENMFPEGTFHRLFKYSNIRLSHFQRNICLLKWLSTHPTRDSILKTVFKFIDNNDRKVLLEKEDIARSFIDPQVDGGVQVKYLINDNYKKEPEDDCFEYDIASGRVPRHYINLYTANFIKYVSTIQDPDSRNAFLTSLDIVKFVHSMISKKQKNEFTVYDSDANSYIAKVDPYKYDEIDWTPDFKLTDKQITRFFTNISFDPFLEHMPDDAKLLFIALTYCAVKNDNFTDNEVFSVLLSYIILKDTSDICTEDSTDVSPEGNPVEKLNLITSSLMATTVLSNYFELTDEKLIEVFDSKILHPLVEFQFCLQHLNYLNTFCGEPYKPTIYSKTYNGTFVYNILYDIKKQHENKYMDFVESNLKCAPGVIAFVSGIMESLNKIKDEIARDTLKSVFFLD
ncbi:hypothetical protein K1T71_000647 [Dendrolimus kikuchii]|uniref:Uncharacterized protein n=1 Tax=Dendrolimus kikuchii TaxID=765133 RepID=A0ACC1DKG6_9NEOP|nr:hypothetical protein K1T71_000647 [Dendrolimus kikuchii]